MMNAILSGTGMLYVWAAVIVLGIAIEAATLNLTTIWFAFGAIAALIAASMGLGIPAQFIIFILFSVLLLVLLRPFCRKFLENKKQPTNADRIIGESAVVMEDIDNTLETGEIKVFGQLWTARSSDDSKISKGSMVRIAAIRGVKAIVEKEKSTVQD